MFVHLTKLRYWKSEHDEATCEDACSDDCARGLFAVADGAGTTLFSNIWAATLATFFVEAPLLSQDPFEVEWWIRQAQARYRQHEPALAQSAWHAWQKTQSQGSHSTLVTLRVIHSTQTTACAELLAFGDSCVLVRKAGSEQIKAFPLAQATDFARPPICLPSRPVLFHRYFHRCQHCHICLEPGDEVMLATDAVARWIISGSAGHSTAGEAFTTISNQTADSWPAFIQQCRESYGMEDDDCTALLLTLQAEKTLEGCPLGATTHHTDQQIEQRMHAFEQAREEQNREQLAILYGDGADLEHAGVSLTQTEILQARQVADAQREVLDALHFALNKPDGMALVETTWAKYATLLESEPCAINLRQTLARIGIITPTAPDERG